MANNPIDTRLDRLERVFDALAKAWTATASSEPLGRAPVVATPFIRKMQAFAATLEPAEADELAVLLAAAAATAKQVAVAPMTDQQRAAAAFLSSLNMKLTSGNNRLTTYEGEEVGPTITTVTIITVIASHPAIGCR